MTFLQLLLFVALLLGLVSSSSFIALTSPNSGVQRQSSSSKLWASLLSPVAPPTVIDKQSELDRPRRNGKNLEGDPHPAHRGILGMGPRPFSHVGQAIHDCLEEHHRDSKGTFWSLTTGAVVGRFHITPASAFPTASQTTTVPSLLDCRETSCGDTGIGNHIKNDRWFPAKLGEILSRCETYADVVSLQPPDGIFLDEFRRALRTIVTRRQRYHHHHHHHHQASTSRPITIRLMFGHMLGYPPLDCQAIVDKLTKGLDEEDGTVDWSNTVQLYVAAWRRGWCRWNHAKMIAVDGRHLHTGGHNLWSQHYLDRNPLHDVSVELTGPVASAAHEFANAQWDLVQGYSVARVTTRDRRRPPRLWSRISPSHVSMASFPQTSHASFPTRWNDELQSPPSHGAELSKILLQRGAEASLLPRHHVPMLTMGKLSSGTAPKIHSMQSSLVRQRPPSDDALLALLTSARRSIRLAIQDLGPRCWPINMANVQIPYPGHPWPIDVLNVLADAITKGVRVDIVLSNQHAICGGLPATETLARPNGWSVSQVVDKIVKAVHQRYPSWRHDRHDQLRQHLRVCAYRAGGTFEDGTPMGLHTKCMIVDDVAFYIGSQNLYVCQLAEWGVVVDDARTTRQLLDEYWRPLWQCSYSDDHTKEVETGTRHQTRLHDFVSRTEAR